MDTSQLDGIRSMSTAQRALLHARLQRNSVADLPVQPRTAGENVFPLSSSQERLWFSHRLAPDGDGYTMPLVFRLDGEVDEQALAAAWRDLVDRHEVLRTTFVERDGEPVQVVSQVPRTELVVRDLHGQLEDHLTVLVGEPFDLGAAAVRIQLIRTGAGQRVLAIVLHHIVCDGWSDRVLWRELSELYRARMAGEVPRLEPLTVQYADFAVWQRQRWDDGELESELDHWRARLSGLAELQLPTDRPRPPVQTFNGAQHTARLDAEVSTRLRELCRAENTTVYTGLLAALGAVLHRYTGQTDLAVGAPVGGRNHPDLESMIGFFVNTVVMRVDLTGDPSFTSLLGRVRGVVLDAYEHQNAPFERVVEAVRPVRDASRSPLFQVMLLADGNVSDMGAALSLGGVPATPITPDADSTQFDLIIGVSEADDAIGIVLEYNTDLFDAATAERFVSTLRTLVDAATAAPEVPMSTLDVLDPVAHARLADWNDTRIPYEPGTGLHDLVHRHSLRQPDATAVVYGQEALTYRQVEIRANRLAHELVARGVRPGGLVGICLSRGLDLPVAVLAALKAGAAFLPLDPDYPRERLRRMLELAGPDVVVSAGAGLADLGVGVPVLDVDESRARVSARPDTPPRVASHQDDLAYVIFTSGSTGEPKGVEITRAGLANWVAAWQATQLDAHTTTWLSTASPSFDVSIGDIARTLGTGRTLVVGDRELAISAELMVAAIRRYGINALEVPPMVLAALGEYLTREPQRLSTLRLVVTGSDSVYAADLDVARRVLGNDVRIINTWGATECTVDNSCFDATEGGTSGNGIVPVGGPIPNSTIHVLDAALRPVPPGALGDLYIGGDGVARGYRGSPRLTAAQFVPDPFAARPGARMYRTGDIGRLNARGAIEFHGRADGQVKLRGFRVEPGEIEAALTRHDGVAAAVVTVHGDTPMTKRLVAYVSGSAVPPVPRLRDHLRGLLPGHMIPSEFVELDRMPVGPNGKLDRAALPPPPDARPDEGYVAPTTERERAVADVWQQVLGVPRVGLHDDFFELGGHSLLATRLIFRLRDALGVDLPLHVVFEASTVAEMIGLVDTSAAPATPIEPVPRTGMPSRFPLSPAQQRLWFLHRLVPDSAAYNVPVIWRLTGPLERTALSRAFTDLVRRHEILRTRFPDELSEPWQEVLPGRPVEITVVEPQGPVSELVDRWSQEPFDLSSAPPLRVALVALGADQHLFVLVMHHIISDGWSDSIIQNELFALYQAHLTGQPAQLPGLPVQYADIAVWQRESAEKGSYDDDVEYWIDTLDGLVELNLPTDRARPAQPSFRGAQVTVDLSPETSRRLDDLCRAQGVTLFVAVLALFKEILHRYTGSTDIAVGSPISGRTRRETEGLIGFFVNTLVLRTSLDGDPTVRELLSRVRATSTSAFAHQELPFERVVAAVGADRSISRNPLVQVMFLGETAATADTARFGDLEIAAAGQDLPVSQFDLTLGAARGKGGLTLDLAYSVDLFEDRTVRRMLGQLARLIDHAVARPELRLSELDSRTDDDAAVLTAMNATARTYPVDAPVTEVFLDWVSRTPEATAVSHGTGSVTYAELDRRSAALAAALADRGVRAGDLVALLTDRSIDMVVAMLAVVRAGAAYVPVDHALPRARRESLLLDANVSVVVGQAHLKSTVPPGPWRWLDIGARPGNAGVPLPAPRGGDACYVLYTSGSSGVPKGVVVPHRAVTSFVVDTRFADLGPGTVIAQLGNYAFDATTFEVWGALLTGGRCAIVDTEDVLVPSRLAQVIHDHGITTAFFTTALFDRIAADQPGAFGGLSALYAGGDTVDPESVRLVREACPGLRLFNGYGPTETTTFAIVHDICGGAPPGRDVPLGRPISNTTVHVLDPTGSPVPLGAVGELCIGGPGVATGYLGRPGLTAGAFVPDPWSDVPGARLYRSGDLGRVGPDDTIHFLGRADQQVKIRGFRVELGEIETGLLAHPGVTQAVVLAHTHTAGRRVLVAYLRCAGAAPSDSELRDFLGAELPSYMVPSAFHRLDAFPLTPNGKIDRAALTALGPSPQDTEQAASPVLGPAAGAVADIWAEVLGRPVGVTELFFALGGNSLDAVRVLARIRDRFDVDLPVRVMFGPVTVADLAGLVEQALTERIDAMSAAEVEAALDPGQGS